MSVVLSPLTRRTSQKVATLKLKHLIFPLIVFLAATIPALADTVYTNEAAFLAAAGTVISQDFGGIASAGSFVSYGSGGSVTLGSVTYSATDPLSTLYIVDAAYSPSYYGFMGAVASLSVQYGTVNIASS